MADNSTIDRLYAEPLKFLPARFPDKVSVQPSSYVSFSSKKDPAARIDVATPEPVLPVSPSKAMRQKVTMAEAVAIYAGKKLFAKADKKRGPKPSAVPAVEDEDLGMSDLEDKSTELSDDDFQPLSKKRAFGAQNVPVETDRLDVVVESDQKHFDSDSDSDEDDDYHTADEVDSNSELGPGSRDAESGSASSESESESDSDSDSDSEAESTSSQSRTRLVELKKQLKDDMSSPSSNNSEAEDDHDEGDADETAKGVNNKQFPKLENTPPTSPEEETAISSGILPLSEFYGFNEFSEDRGSNGSKRIFKNWRELVNSEPIGLLNQGVTCYMNSAVQSLIHVPALQHYLKDVYQGKYDKQLNPRSVTKTLADTSARLWQFEISNTGKKSGHFLPRKLIKRLGDINCMMSEWQQEDSHEYFMSLMSRLQEDSTPKGVKLNQSIIYDIFGGLLHQSVTCKSCGHISNTQQEFYDLSLSLDNRKKRNSSILDTNQLKQLKEKIESSNSHNADEDKDDQKSMSEFLESRVEARANPEFEQKPQSQSNTDRASPAPAQPQVADLSPKYSIESSIRDFFSPEIIKTDKKDKTQGGYECENCKKRTVAVKISRIDRAPETLAIHLKRFRFNGIASSKVKTNVSYPAVLDLTEYTTSMKLPVKYVLSSVIVHEGRSVSSGHYIAHCRQPDGSWATYDDEYINKIPEKQALKNSSAYVLVYTRLTHKSIPLGQGSGSLEPLKPADKKRKAGSDSNYRLNKSKKRKNRR
ncbi:unnamed protein product [Kuraishia capsulata CBS 1993]|uniref:ubiquitinyl hydrolase 1 n=1 Tax=Kuraishia capsulata CBS 1993 TaxID=1382522 RepID=W6MQ66_9ASCO|nr:uncharacterized protein KUCA_T00004811001 [Kuraishia capsulata CBS 1993]CDK28826.1 unnamed protein product [Kuraishia capsulata CBS 1993]